MNQTTAPAALERLRRHLYEAGIHPAVDHEAGAPAFLHAGCVSISATPQHYRIEHLDDEGETRRTITLAHTRTDDAVRLCGPTSPRSTSTRDRIRHNFPTREGGRDGPGFSTSTAIHPARGERTGAGHRAGGSCQSR